MSVGKKIKRIHMAFERVCNQTLMRYKVTAAQLELLRFVHDRAQAGEIVNQRRIEAALNVKNPTVTGLLNRLEAKGFIRRVPDPADARIKLVQLTSLEEQMRSELIETIRGMDTRLTAGFSEEETAALDGLLDKVLLNIESEMGERSRLW